MIRNALRATVLLALLGGLLVATALTASAASAASAAAPAWSIKARWGDTNLPPGGEGQFVLTARNAGDAPADESENLVISDQLPDGVVATRIRGLYDSIGLCSGVGTSVVTCEVPSFFAPVVTAPPNDTLTPTGFGQYEGHQPRILIDVEIAADAGPTGTNVATMSAGGATPAVDTDQVTFSSSPTSFGVVPGTFEADTFDQAWPAGEVERQAGAHPSELRVDFDLNHSYGVYPQSPFSANGPYTIPHGRIRAAEVTLPPGLIGNPEALPKCPQELFAQTGFLTNWTLCPANTQVGFMTLELAAGATENGYSTFNPGGFRVVPIYSLEPPKGQVVDFGFTAAGIVQGHIYATLDPAQNYAIKTITPDISDLAAVRESQVTFWGVPGDPAHDHLRWDPSKLTTPADGETHFRGVSVEGEQRPFLSLPMDCGFENGASRIRVSSYQDPNSYTPHIEADSPLNVEGCDDPRFRFNPDVTLQPTARAAGGPTGLDVHLKVPQRDDAVEDTDELYADNGDIQAIPTPPIKKVVVTMPEGMTLSPSAAQGLGNCSPEQIGLGNNNPVTCPDDSQYGTLTLHTPLLPKDEPMHGQLYIAKQNDNPYKDFLALYLVVEDPSRGLRVKVPAHIELDPVTGQIKTIMDDLPQFPIEDTQLTFKGGVRAALVNPSTCGQKTIKAEFFSWQDPNTPKVVTDSYQVTQKPDGSPCVNNLGERPFDPQIQAGTESNSAGSYSPFIFRLTRTDDDQEFSQLGVTLPPGLLANISGITECSVAGIAQAGTPGRTGLEELMSPSCPASSQIGTTDVGTGVGVPLTYVPGKVYLAGRYQGAPLSLVVITPLQVGPYDLGVIAVRSAIRVNAQTAQASITTDPFPQIYRGIPVRIRDIRVNADRPNTMINPTSCDPMEVTAHVTGTGGDVNSTADDTAKDLASRFQASNCSRLGFKPNLTFKLKGGTKRGQFPALQATLRARPGDANIAKTTVVLPRSEFIEQGHIRTVCTRVQFAANQCPAGSIYGTATAKSPLFDETLSGPVYLRSNGGERVLPDLVVSLNGKINVSLAGFVDSTKEGRVRNTFDVIPDAPVTEFKLSMQGGKKGLLVNHLDLCEVTARADVMMVGQNGKVAESRPKMGTSCKTARKKQRSKR